MVWPPLTARNVTMVPLPARFMRQDVGMDATEELKRVRAGLYQTHDGRFNVEQSDATWYVRDSKRRDQFGQPVLTGPYRTLGEARNAVGTLRVAED